MTRGVIRERTCGQVRSWSARGRVGLIGEVDISNVDFVRSVLAEASAEGGGLVVDLSGLSFIDVAGATELVECARKVGPAGRLKVLDPPPQLAMILSVAGWTDEVDCVLSRVAS